MLNLKKVTTFSLLKLSGGDRDLKDVSVAELKNADAALYEVYLG